MITVLGRWRVTFSCKHFRFEISSLDDWRDGGYMTETGRNRTSGFGETWKEYLFVLEYFDFKRCCIWEEKINNGHYSAWKILNNRFSVLLSVIYPISKSLKDLSEVFALKVYSLNIRPPRFPCFGLLHRFWNFLVPLQLNTQTLDFAWHHFNQRFSGVY